MKCPGCEHNNFDHAKFCNNCGFELRGICTQCSTQNPEGANYCFECGSELLRKAEGKNSKLLSKQQLSFKRESKESAERRQLTVLFCDLVGSTALSEKLDPEDYRQVIINYQQVVEKVVMQYGGYIAQYLGDGLLVYFGYPKGLENAPQAAVEAGLDILGAVEKANEEWVANGKTEIAIRIGINSGLVVVDDRLALGDTVNIAARLEGLAPQNSMVISPKLRKLTGGWFETKSLGKKPLKGIKKPLEIFQVLGKSKVQTRLEIRKMKGLSPLIGRDEELDLLIRNWSLAKQGSGQLIMITGEAGIGKSRLADYLKKQIIREPDSVHLEIRCSSHHTHSPFYPLITLLENKIIGFKKEEKPKSKIDKLKKWLRHARFPLIPNLLIYAEFLAIPVPDE